jgi:hypothetical protein
MPLARTAREFRATHFLALMFAYPGFRSIAALCIALCLAPTQAAEMAATKPVPFNTSLKKECGIEKNEPLEKFANRPLAWCAFDGTQLSGGTTDTAALAGRRLYVSIQFEPTGQRQVPITLTLSSFSATGQVKTHLGMSFQVGRERLEASMYVPDDAASVYFVLTGGGARAEKDLVIHDIQTHVSQTRFQPEQMCAACREYLDDAIDRVRQNFLLPDRLQLDDLARSLRLAATGAQDIREMDGPMKELARQLAAAELSAGMRPHGNYQTKAELAANISHVSPAPVQQRAMEVEGPLFETKLLADRVGYIRLRTFMDPEANSANSLAYARALRDAVIHLHDQGAGRWIIDLREHNGGTIFPAIAALRPLLGKGAVGYFIDARGKRLGAWEWGAPGLPVEAAGTYFTGQDRSFDGDRQATAILIGPATASTGEMLAIAFHRRPNTRSFGAPTAGYATIVNGATDRYGNFFGITAGYATDRHGERIFPKVVPDVMVDRNQAQPGQSDPVLGAAVSWLAGQR